MTYFYFPPNEEVVIRTNKEPIPRVFPVMTYMYESTGGLWYVRDPKSETWIVYLQEGVPEIYKTQVLLLTAAYPD